MKTATPHLLPVESWKHDLLRWLVIIWPFSFSLDFKGEGGGSLSQVLMAIVSVLVFGAIFLAGSIRATASSKRVIFSSCWVAVVGCLTAAYYHVPWEQTIRILLPYWLFIAGVWVGAIAVSSIRLSWELFQAMVAAGIASLFFRYYYATNIAGLALEGMRYQVLSPAICSLLAYVCASFCFMRKLSMQVLITAAATMVMVALSVTRSFVLTFGFAAIAVPLITWRLSWRNQAHKVYFLWRKIGLIFVVSAAIVGVFAAYELRPDLFASWSGRIYYERVNTESGDDVNYVTRVAEAKGIWDDVSESSWRLLWGKGFGNSYQWAYEYSGEIRSVSADMVYAFFVPNWQPAHSPFTFALFFGGIPALVWQLYIFASPLREGWKQMRPVRSCVDTRFLQLFTFNFLSLILYLSQSFTSNPFGERLSGQFLGISIGMLLGTVKLLQAIESSK